MPLSEKVAAAVKTQVEFYFSDSNLPRDKFLLEIIRDPLNDEQWVDLKTIASFSRMRNLLKAFDIQPEKVPEEAIKAVAEVLRDSEEVTVSEDGQKVKRTKPLGPIEEAIKAQDECSLFAAPFPFSATLEQLTAFFSKVAPVKCVRMRRHLNSRDFRGSVFVEFDTLESANKVKDMVLEYEGATIRLQPKTEFKEQVIEERHSKAASRPQKQKKAEEIDFKKGLIVHFKFQDDVDEEMTREVIRETMGGEEQVAFIDYSRGSEEGHLRFQSPEAAEKAMDALGECKEKDFGGKKAVLRKVEGAEEAAFWKQVRQSQADYKSRLHQNRARGRGRGRGGGKRGREDAGDGNGATKAAKTC